MESLFCCFYIKNINLTRQQAWSRLYLWLCLYVSCWPLIESFTTFLTSSVGIPLQSTLLQVSIMHKCKNVHYTLIRISVKCSFVPVIPLCFTGSHDIHIDIRGESMLAKLLRKTVGAFNTSANIDLHSSNWRRCLSSFVHYSFFILLQWMYFM